MPSRPPVQTPRSVLRTEIAKLTSDTRLQRALENLIGDTSIVLPDAIEGLSEDEEMLLSNAAFQARRNPVPDILDTASPILAAQIFGA